MNMVTLHITQHLPASAGQAGKRFVSYGTYPCLRAGTHRQANFCFAKTSFMLKPLGETVALYEQNQLEDVR